MSGKVYAEHWLKVLQQVVTEPMQRSFNIAHKLKMNKGTCVHVLVVLEKNGYIGQYNYTFKNVYTNTLRFYYPTDKGQQTVMAFIQ